MSKSATVFSAATRSVAASGELTLSSDFLKGLVDELRSELRGLVCE